MVHKITFCLVVLLCAGTMTPAGSGIPLCLAELVTGVSAHHHEESISPEAVCHSDDVAGHVEDHATDHRHDESHPPCEEECISLLSEANAPSRIHTERSERPNLEPSDIVAYTGHHAASERHAHDDLSLRTGPVQHDSSFLCRFTL